MPSLTIFKDFRVLDCALGGSAEPRDGVSVVVEGTAIKDVLEPGRRVAVPREATVVDGAGRTLIPGLIDAHVHLGAIDVNVLEQHRRYPASLASLKIAHRIRDALRQGFTTVRDAGGADWGFREAVEEGLIEGPRILVANRPLSQTGGHGDFRRQVEDGDPVGCCPTVGYVMQVCDGPDEVLRAARDQLRKGSDHVKVMASGGAMSPTDTLESCQFSVAEIKSAVMAAENAGKYVMAHAISPEAIRNCLEAGVRSIEHGNFIDDRTAKEMAALGTYLVPTLSVYAHLAEEGSQHNVSASSMAKIRVAHERGFEAVQIAHAHGVKIGSGSDLLGEGAACLAREIQLKASVLGNYEAIVSATRTNAELLGLSASIGTIQTGKEADILLLNEDPTADISCLTRPDAISAIVKAGRIVAV